MFILVRHSDNIIIGSATSPVDRADASKNGCMVFEIDDAIFNLDLIGSKLESFEEVK